MKALQIKVVDFTTNPNKATSQIKSLLKSNLLYLEKEDFSNHEQYGTSADEFGEAIKNLKNQQLKVIKRLEELKPNQKVAIDCQINLTFH